MSLRVDFGKTASDYGRYRAGFPDEFFDRLCARGTVGRGDALLDLGTGTGTLARGLAERGCAVTALDASQDMLGAARSIAADYGVKNIQFVTGKAEELPFDDGAFDVVTAGQCWHWFDRKKAAAEAFRVLQPGGRIVIAHFDWIPLPGNVVDATEHLIMRHNPHWKMASGTGLHPQWLADAANAGFTDLETFSFDERVPYTHVAWCGRIRASAGVAASLSQEKVGEFDRELAALLTRDFPGDLLVVPHRVWALVATKP